MSDHAAKSYYSSDGTSGQPIHFYQSAWMSHWAGTGYDALTQKHNYSFSPCGGNRDDHDLKKMHQLLSGAEIARSAKRQREVEHGSAENIMGMAVSSRNLKSENEISGMQASRPEASRGKLPAVLNILPVSVPAAETSTGECQFQPGGLLQLPVEAVEQVKYHMFFGESNFSCSRQRSNESESHAVPNRLDVDQFKFDSGRIVVPSFIRRQEETILSLKHVTETNLTVMGQEQCNHQGDSAVLVCDGKRSNLPERENAAPSYIRQNNTTALKIGPSASTYNSPVDDDGQHQWMKINSGGKFFPSSSHASEMNKPGNLQYGQCTQKSTPRVHGVLDSAEGLAGGQSRLSQTDHSLLITQQTEFNSCTENQIFREFKETTHLNQSTSSELGRNFPLFNHGKQGVKLQLIGSYTDSEEKEDAGVFKTPEIVQKNESSAETDIMDMESFGEKVHLSGVSPPPSNKDMMMGPNLEPKIASTAASGSQKRTFELPDINLELHAPDSPGSTEKPEPSTSKTQSLDMELLLINSGKPGNSKSPDCQDAPLESEPSSRWVKRLKLTTPNSASLRINNSNQEEPLSHEDGNNLFSNKTMKGPTMSHRPGKELMVLSQTTKLLETGESSSIDTRMKEHDITLSHSWIKRWRHNQDKKKPGKLGTGDSEKKQYPSIAAMALMGKVMNGFFQPCQFKKKKSFIVWNTKNL